MTTSTVDKLTYLNDTKNAIKAAIRRKGQTVLDSDSFRSYAEKIDNITTGGMDTVTATNYTESAISTGDKVWINKEGTDYKLVDFYKKYYNNFNVVGSPSIDRDIGYAGNFSDSNYLSLPETFSPGNNTWEISTCITTQNNIRTDYETHFFGCNYNTRSILLLIKYVNSSFYLTCYLSSDHSNFDISAASARIPFTPGVKTWCKLAFTGTSYVLSSSTDGSNWTSETITSSSTIAQGDYLYLGASWQRYNQYLQGSVDLTQTYIKIGNSVWWNPGENIISDDITEDTLTGTAAENIAVSGTGDVYIGEIIEPTLGTKTITQNGIYNASSDNLDGFSSVTVDVSGDTVTATNNTGSAITSGDKVWIEKVGDNYNLIKSKKRNFIVNGTLTIDDENETISGFSPANYINQWVGLTSSHHFKMYVKFTTPDSMPTDNTWWFKVMNTATFLPFYLDPYVGKIVAFGKTASSSSWNIFSNKEICALTTSTTYQLMCEFTGSAYIWYQYTGGSWVELTRGTSSSYTDSSSIIMGKVDGSGTFGNGTIDLSECWVEVENEIVWQPYLSNLSESNSTGYALENIASGATGNVKTVLPEE